MQNKNDNLIIEMKDISKFFPGTRALDHVSLKLRKGEIHALDRRERSRKKYSYEYPYRTAYKRWRGSLHGRRAVKALFSTRTH